MTINEEFCKIYGIPAKRDVCELNYIATDINGNTLDITSRCSIPDEQDSLSDNITDLIKSLESTGKTNVFVNVLNRYPDITTPNNFMKLLGQLWKKCIDMNLDDNSDLDTLHKNRKELFYEEWVLKQLIDLEIPNLELYCMDWEY